MQVHTQGDWLVCHNPFNHLYYDLYKRQVAKSWGQHLCPTRTHCGVHCTSSHCGGLIYHHTTTTATLPANQLLMYTRLLMSYSICSTMSKFNLKLKILTLHECSPFMSKKQVKGGKVPPSHNKGSRVHNSCLTPSHLQIYCIPLKLSFKHTHKHTLSHTLMHPQIHTYMYTHTYICRDISWIDLRGWNNYGWLWARLLIWTYESS